MTIRALAFAACLALTGCAAAEQLSGRLAVETPNFLKPEETVTLSYSTGAHPTLGPRGGRKMSSESTLQSYFIKTCPKTGS
jgi:hypothetical protein